MGIFDFSLFRKSQPLSIEASTQQDQNQDASLSSRNAFVNFLREYRRNYHPSPSNIPIWRITIEAANRWNNMTLREKYSYIQSAHKANYIYRARDRNVNRIMKLLRKALLTQDHINIPYLMAAVKQMRLWKQKILSDILN
ncbi:uncharacterized protein LOC142238375 [Haematobia irritans]|uniref:uncharacterized protein LOC142238375 n=1 Tax=Haematobia irritans TaxID=7368 RepID=UPI003F509F74